MSCIQYIYFNFDVIAIMQTNERGSFAANTVVLGMFDYKNIQDLVVGDLVMTHKNSAQPITRVTYLKSRVVKIRATGILPTLAASTQPYYTRTIISDNQMSEVTWKEAGSLTLLDYIGVPLLGDENQKALSLVLVSTLEENEEPRVINDVAWIPIESIEQTDKELGTYRIEVAQDHSFIANNAIVSN